MKARRQMRILELIRGHVVETQEQLAELLGREGIEVTQATVSRDIKELNLVKVPAGDGRYRYMPSDDSQPAGTAEKMRRLLSDCCVSVDCSENMVVIKTLSGTAMAVGEAIDNLRWDEIVGCVAGDNTILMVVKPKEAATEVVERLRRLTS